MGWSKKDRALLDAILDQLIPANPDRAIPGAGELGVAGFIEDRAMQDGEFRNRVSSLLHCAQGMAGEVSPDVVRQLETTLPDAFASLLIETYKGYYCRPDMRARVGVGAHPVHPTGYDVARETPEMLAELTAPVRARGPVYRDPTGGKA